MNARPLDRPLPGEHVVGLSPRPARLVDAGWRRRVHFFTGRSLSDTALRAEATERDGRVAALAQGLSAGVVAGLAADLERHPDGDAVVISPGHGLRADGQDVFLNRPLRVVLAAVPLAVPRAGVENVGQLPRPLLGVLVLRPFVTGEIDRPDPEDRCDRDPRNAAFEDWRVVDACRLVFHELALADFAPNAGADWRNRAAFKLFEKEAARDPDGGPPTRTPEDPPTDDFVDIEWFGVAVGLVGQVAGGPFFLDSAAVVRDGGKPKRRTPLVPGAGDPFLWQARIRQFAEHVAEVGGTADARLGGAFRFLPPVGALPRGLFDLGSQTFFPLSYDIDAVPVPREQLDALVAGCAALAPFDAQVPDRVRVLFPVPQAVYEPRLLLTETIDPQFEVAEKELIARRAEWLKRRQQVRAFADAAAIALDGKPRDYPNPDPDKLDKDEPASAADFDEGGDRVAPVVKDLATALGGIKVGTEPLLGKEQLANLVKKGGL
ncbi:MAG TPA: hypothetical protein VMZ71_17615, partial [Gemmataceae bacterium]|nr:hypothetical protein [Gemmataceae bacterium]